MLENFQLAAIAKQGGVFRLLRIPLLQSLQQMLASTWEVQLELFITDVQEISFNAGYQPEEHECFVVNEFEPPEWLANETSQRVVDLDSITNNQQLLHYIRGLVGFARDSSGAEVVMFQNFSRSHVIGPGRFLLLRHDTYETTPNPGLALDSKLSAVYFPDAAKLLFRNFHTVNTFLPLADFYKEASEEEILNVLGHELLAPEDPEGLARGANQWFRKRFAMLRDSKVLDRYTARQIQERSQGYDVRVRVSKKKIVFPVARPEAKKLLQFLNEELFRGPITKKLYETNSKREAD